MADVTIVDSSPRDGPVAFPAIHTSEKIALTNSLVQCGLAKIDCVAFTHPRIRPEFADAEKVIHALNTGPEVTFIGIAPNEIACRRALNTNVDEIGTLVAASESFNRSVLGISIRETLYKAFPAIFQACTEKGKSIRVYILAAFHCQHEGRVPIENLVELASKLAFMGVSEISLVDTPGTANPKQVKETVAAFDSFASQYAKQLLARVPLTPNRKARLERAHFHSLGPASEIFQNIFDINILSGISDVDVAFGTLMFHRRHVYEHKGGEADEKYIADSEDNVRLKQTLRETQESAHRSANLVMRLAANLHRGFHDIFPPLEEPIRWHEQKKRPG